MNAESTQNLRVIIQFIRGEIPKYSRFRLIAYGSDNFRPTEALSFTELTQRFASAGIPPEQRPIPPEGNLQHTTIVFTADLALTPTQLQILGLGR
jgi:hypothetical protein